MGLSLQQGAAPSRAPPSGHVRSTLPACSPTATQRLPSAYLHFCLQVVLPYLPHPQRVAAGRLPRE